ncbi:Cruciform DNA binding protein [Emydomyces testavorans]|uniref:Cruciform DNA binding protein n=1 Tax=Emydomyces testavorans TaxID=2070801 RepID=A0AAF0DBT7_9EURO|nr:Cruciform DNA binding protein [Emydomyces testavorans]
MGLYTFKWAHPANEVYVTGTFDNWSKSIKLEKSVHGDFRKEIDLPETNERILYKFIVDGTWTTDHTAPQEDDGHHNINNVLQPGHVQPLHPSTANSTSAIAGTGGTAAMSGVTPEATTAGLAGNVPKEPKEASESALRKVAESDANGPAPFTLSTLDPESTTAQLAKDVPLEPKSRDTPGGFPETPGMEDPVSINPFPATDGIGNPIHLQPGEKVPNPSSITDNTVNSGVTTDKAGYERDASDPAMAALAATQGTIGTQPVQVNPPTTGGAPFIQSAAPASTTSALAANVPLEKFKTTNAEGVHEAVSDVPEVVRKSLSEAHMDPEAASNREAVEEKREVEQELLRDIKRDESAGEPAPVVTAATSTSAPAATEPRAKKEAGDVSPKTKEPAEGNNAATPQQPPPTAGPTETGASGTTGPQQAQAQPSATETHQPPTETPKEKKKKHRVSGFFSKLKEKLK